MLKVQPIPHVYLMAGVDDVLNFQVNTMGLSPQDVGYGFDYFFGAGLTFEVGLGSQIYIEAKYHRAETDPVEIEYIPVVLGYRW